MKRKIWKSKYRGGTGDEADDDVAQKGHTREERGQDEGMSSKRDERDGSTNPKKTTDSGDK